MKYRLVKSEDLTIGDELKSLFITNAKIVFIRWFKGHKQNLGYVVVDDGKGSHHTINIYKGEEVDVLN